MEIEASSITNRGEDSRKTEKRKKVKYISFYYFMRLKHL